MSWQNHVQPCKSWRGWQPQPINYGALVSAPTHIRPPSHVSFVQGPARFGGSNLCSNTVANVAMDVAAAHSSGWRPRSIYGGWLLSGG